MPKNKFYITATIPYVNASPHLGHTYEFICCDVIARWHRLLEENVFYLVGTDENAGKNASAAKIAGIPIRDFIKEKSDIFNKLTKELNLSNNFFIRTTEKRHVDTAKGFFERAYKRGDIYKGFYEGYYCEGCEAFLTKKDLINGNCPDHKKEPKWIKEENYFFKMSKYEKKILNLLSRKGFVYPEKHRREVYTRAKNDGLKDFSVSRYKQIWGIDVPFDKNHKQFVWYDALINYISALDYPDGENFRKYWPADIHIVGKGGVTWFHAVVWSAILLSEGLELPKRIAVHGYLTLNGQKMSKSLGNVVDPVELINNYGADQVRYYLIREIPFGDDGDFSLKKFKNRINGELVKELGNLVSRSLSLAEKVKGKIEGKAELKLDLKKINRQMDKLELHHALESVFGFIKDVNRYINTKEPWKLKGNELSNVVYNLCESLKIIAILLSPFIPKASQEICNQLGINLGKLKDCYFTEFKGQVKKSKHLFEPIL